MELIYVINLDISSLNKSPFKNVFGSHFTEKKPLHSRFVRITTNPIPKRPNCQPITNKNPSEFLIYSNFLLITILAAKLCIHSHKVLKIH